MLRSTSWKYRYANGIFLSTLCTLCALKYIQDRSDEGNTKKRILEMPFHISQSKNKRSQEHQRLHTAGSGLFMDQKLVAKFEVRSSTIALE
ncbi:hypothetical protein NDU88_005003 [Pleurodeles waltl]|uniref:Uncharacterized protein n=1 Tax=Pleurodeles waltl TaxID=8319 RepID=A0AAV7TVC3_PLEWA|nr:hypothetical protein NDU88_005003 [Pleurodeles waltl]